MAKKIQSFRIDEKKKAIIIYTNVEPIAAEETVKTFYLNKGYMPLLEEKKKGITVEEMREEMKDDIKALEEFNKLYTCKDKKKIEEKKAGFHAACKFFNKWVKEQEKAE